MYHVASVWHIRDDMIVWRRSAFWGWGWRESFKYSQWGFRRKLDALCSRRFYKDRVWGKWASRSAVRVWVSPALPTCRRLGAPGQLLAGRVSSPELEVILLIVFLLLRVASFRLWFLYCTPCWPLSSPLGDSTAMNWQQQIPPSEFIILMRLCDSFRIQIIVSSSV